MLPHPELRFHRTKVSPLAARLFAMIGLAGAILFGASTARSAPKDAAATELLKKAINDDYLATKFADAEKKLKQAIAMCKPSSACTPATRAQLYSNLGTVYAGGMSKPDEATAAFAEALKIDPNVVPNPDLVSPDVEAAFKKAKKGAPAPAPAGDGDGDSDSTPAPAEPKSSAGAGSGDLVHTPVAEQAILTPVPVYAELPAGQTAKRMQVNYKPWGGSEWKSLEMKHLGKGYGIEIPCVELGSAGDLSYYIQALDAEGNLVSWSGTRAEPVKVPIKQSLEGEPPHLPGQPPSAKCADSGDCPPDFPGCHNKDEPKPGEDAPCPPDQECPSKAPVFKNWISIGIQQDFQFVPAQADVCGPTNANYSCFDSNNKFYNLFPYSVPNNPGAAGDQAQAGVVAATTRLLAGFDRVLGTVGPGNIVLGARVGVVLRGKHPPADGSFFLLHLEGRLTYWFGKDSFSTQLVRPYLILGGGAAEVGGSENIPVYNTLADYKSNTITNLTAWKKAGPGFIEEGLGTMIAVTPRTGPLVEFKFMELLGNSGVAMNASLGWAIGF